MDTGLRDRVAWVTGASGGIGRAIVEAFASEGAAVAAHAHTGGDALQAWVASTAWDDRVAVVTGDVRDPAACDAMVGRIRDRFGRVDACVVNAGIWCDAAAPLHEMPVDRVRDVIDVNLLGAIWTARAFLRALATDGPAPGGASITLIGSTAGRFGEAGNAEYAASKAALVGLMRSLKNEIVRLDPAGRVNLVEPGWTRTPMTAATLDDPDHVRRAVRTMPLRQLATPDDVARAVVVLASPRSGRHLSGQTLTVAGGMEGRVLWDDDA